LFYAKLKKKLQIMIHIRSNLRENIYIGLRQ
jgi:hypothetical protein